MKDKEERFLTEIISQRRYYGNLPSYKIVYEWEDIIASHLGLKICQEHDIKFKFHRRFENNGAVGLFHSLIPQSKHLRLRFVMQARARELCILDCNTIPVIIDFWLKDNELGSFYDAYKHCPLVLITSAEVYEHLKEHNCTLPIEHWPLSYPDQYRMTPDCVKDKEYEFCIFGRPNPFFIRLLDQYCQKHSDFTYIHSSGDIQHRVFINHKGEVVMKDTGRRSYLDMIHKTKISCYTTPGIDESKKETGRFNQVTPRLFEMLTNGCQVIGHYTDNPDTRYYELQDIVPNVNNYQGFEQVLNRFRDEPFNYGMISKYLRKHYTSTRIPMLEEILHQHSISIQPINNCL